MGREALMKVLQETRALLARPGNTFDWSSWEDADAAVRELDEVIASVRDGASPDRLRLSMLFAPTGPIQEVSLSSGWGQTFLELAERFHAAKEWPEA